MHLQFEPEIVRPGQIVTFGWHIYQERNWVTRVKTEFNIQQKLNEYCARRGGEAGLDVSEAFADFIDELQREGLLESFAPDLEVRWCGAYTDDFKPQVGSIEFRAGVYGIYTP